MHGRHFIQEDSPEQIGAAQANWYASLGTDARIDRSFPKRGSGKSLSLPSLACLVVLSCRSEQGDLFDGIARAVGSLGRS